jgi:transcriptional regulator GlxA family with amidase domain
MPSQLRIRTLVVFGLVALLGCRTAPDAPSPSATDDAERVEQALASDSILTAGVVALDQVYNTELVAPYDVFEHTYYRDSTRFIAPFLVSPDGAPVTTFEGVEIAPHYSFETAPPIDVLVVPSTSRSRGADLKNERFLRWLEATARKAEYVISICYGAFPLVATGLLDGRQVTTFPAAQDELAERFPAVTVRRDVRYVVDGKFITSVGGARSYEPALHLVDRLYGPETARSIAGGLVLPWTPDEIPHAVVRRE